MPTAFWFPSFSSLGFVLLLTTIAIAQEKPMSNELVEVARWKTKLTMFNDLQLTNDGLMLLVQGTLGKTEAWDVRKKQRLWRQETATYAHVLNGKDDGEFLWVDQSKGPAAIVHSGLLDGKERKRTPLKDAEARLWNVEFGMGTSPEIGAQAEYSDGSFVVSFSLATGERKSSFRIPLQQGQESGIEGLGISANGKQFMITAPKSLVLCNDQGTVLQRFKTASNVSRIRFLPDQKLALAAGTAFGSPLYFLELKTGKTTERKEHRYGTTALEVSTDGKWAITGGNCRMAAERDYYARSKQSEGGEVVLWDLSTQQPIVKLNPFFDSVKGVGISANGRFVAAAETGDSEGQIVVYEVKEKM